VIRKYQIIVLVSIISAGLSANDLLNKASEAYDNKKYKEAISHYNQLLNEGKSSYEVYYNLGNAHYRNKELGYAIYNYELARKLNPKDQDVQINLAIASSKTIDKIESRENFFVAAIKSGIINTFSTRTWGILSIVLAFLSSIFFFLFMLGQSANVKRITFSLSLLCLVGMAAVYLFGKSAVNSKSENKFAIILMKEVKIVNEPNKSGVLKFNLHEGSKVRIIEVSGDWVLIKLDNGNEGWVKQAEVGVI